MSNGIRRRTIFGAVMAFCGLSALGFTPLALAQEIKVPESATAAVPNVVVYPPAPAGFDPLTASDNDLKRYGFPPRPDAQKAPQAYRHWRALVSVPRIGNPTLQQTDIYDGPAKLAPAKNAPQ